MAAFKHLLSNTHRLSNPPPPLHLVSLLRRRFSSEPQPPEPNSNLRNPVPIQPVSYPAKPSAPPPEETHHEHPPETQPPQSEPREYARPEARSWARNDAPYNNNNNANPVISPVSYAPRAEKSEETQQDNSSERQSWSRDEMRYMKDASSINPVSYAARVAPLPEDRGNAGVGEGLEWERKRIEERRRAGFMRFARPEAKEEEEEQEKLPFPKLIKAGDSDKKSKEKAKVVYDVKEAIRLVKANARKTFVETLEGHVRMARELVRTDLKLDGSVRLPHGAGKTFRVAVFAEGAAADEAREAGADIVGGPELVENIFTGKSKVTFDKCVATPAMMKHIKKISKFLKKKMPDVKKGTLTNDIARAVKDAKERVPFEKDKTAIVHVPLGKVNLAENSLKENIGAFVHALLLAKPAGLKKSSKFAGYVDAFHITSTMGGSYPVSIQSLSMAADHFSKMQVK